MSEERAAPCGECATCKTAKIVQLIDAMPRPLSIENGEKALSTLLGVRTLLIIEGLAGITSLEEATECLDFVEAVFEELRTELTQRAQQEAN